MLKIHTLGPPGTNCEKAAKVYLDRRGIDGQVLLYETLEEAADEMMCTEEPDDVLLGCIVYPYLHELVFRNHHWMKLVDCFVVDTYDMVFASRLADVSRIASIGSHPAPVDLLAGVTGLPGALEPVLVTSNAEAARLCAAGRFDGCISTRLAAERAGLHILQNFGPVPMGFSIHAKGAHQ
ncbi:hypothetical protein WKR88_05085 [Trinickia caryophylli]|uniref:Prephenate dehydratase n=1 Tax=Trinickia caryophylli TaxID=28094 RepID=A0A1X7FKT8_TRICW|nr:hypothetical protein [Trinickia caryophylli]PMS13189.1 hypothetical protein C0Z17_05170 [Trinickia caryophylli]TRX19285.1 hypothetical protein FNF07_14315 [Trinickia caryophylli]WQE13412.1 hypothetical protein U0034_08630 [Trinickia caryophylli]SMF53261.1 hypothetical protein SAMN06295900_109105 [Trinickia caryophylli]GLU34065.1 hypothetical protein Busp01_39070 [Trinickia caryophylli]